MATTTKPGVEGEIERNPIRDILGVQSPQESIEYCNLMAYGFPGVGKTYLCGTACDDENTFPALLIDIDGGAMTLRKRKELDVKQVRKMQDVEFIHDELRKQYDSTGEMYYKTVMVDSGTFLQKLDMVEVMRYAERKAPARFTEPKFERVAPSPKEWGISNERMKLIILAYKDLPCHFIMTALERTIKDKEGTVIGYEPNIGGGDLRDNLPGYFDIVGRMTSTKTHGGAEVERKMQTVKTNKVVAKDRSDVLPESIEAPSIPLIWAMMQESSLLVKEDSATKSN